MFACATHYCQLGLSAVLSVLQELRLGSSLVPDCPSTRLSSLGQVLLVWQGPEQQIAAAAHRPRARRYGGSSRA